MQRRTKFLRILVLGLLSAIGPFSIDMYLPGFPAIAKELHTDISHVAFTLSAFFIGISFGQLLYGPLLDKFGRKKPLYFGLSVYIMASLACIFAKSIEIIITLRFLQALGGCVGMVASRAIVRDLFSVEENAKIFSLLMLVIGVSPVIAPTLGGYVTASIGWRYIFVILTLIGAMILAMVIFLLPESKDPDPHYSLKPGFILKRFGSVFKESQFVTYATTGALAAAGLYAYIAGSPHVFMEIFGASEKVYGWIFATVAGSMILATQLNTVLLRKTTSEKIIPRVVLFQSFTGLVLVIGFMNNWWGLQSSVLLCCIFLACQGFTFPNASALSLAPFEKNAGSASALLGCIQMGIGTLTSALVSIFHNNTAVPMGFIMALCAMLAFTTLMLGRRMIGYKARIKDVEEQSVDMIGEI